VTLSNISSVTDSIAQGDIRRRIETATKNPMLMQRYFSCFIYNNCHLIK